MCLKFSSVFWVSCYRSFFLPGIFVSSMLGWLLLSIVLLIILFFFTKFLINLYQDCPNGEDENYCGVCNFEDYNDPYCTYANVNTDTFMWSIGTGGTLTANTGPSNDHTLGTNKGIYLTQNIRPLVVSFHSVWCYFELCLWHTTFVPSIQNCSLKHCLIPNLCCILPLIHVFCYAAIFGQTWNKTTTHMRIWPERIWCCS